MSDVPAPRDQLTPASLPAGAPPPTGAPSLGARTDPATEAATEPDLPRPPARRALIPFRLAAGAILVLAVLVWAAVIVLRYLPARYAPQPFDAVAWERTPELRTDYVADLLDRQLLDHRTPDEVEALLGVPDHFFVSGQEAASTAAVPAFQRLAPRTGTGAVAYALGARLDSLGALVTRRPATPRYLILEYAAPREQPSPLAAMHRGERATTPVVVNAWVDPPLPSDS